MSNKKLNTTRRPQGKDHGLGHDEKIREIREADGIVLSPVAPVRKARGFLESIRTDVPREIDRA
jgi:hypothetical protein